MGMRWRMPPPATKCVRDKGSSRAALRMAAEESALHVVERRHAHLSCHDQVFWTDENDEKYICRRYFTLIYLYCIQIFHPQINDFSRT